MGDKEGGTRLMTLRVTPEQETAMEAFFQINNWALIKEGTCSIHENRSSGFLTWSHTNQAVQPHKMARGLRFCI